MIVIGIKKKSRLNLRKKSNTAKKSSRDTLIFICSLIPRLLIASVIGVVVSEPIKVKLFQSVINDKYEDLEIEKLYQKKLGNYHIQKQKFDDEITKYSDKINELEEKIEKFEEKIEKDYTLLNEEIAGRNGDDPGYGDQSRKIEEKIQRNIDEIKKIDIKILAIQDDIISEKQKREKLDTPIRKDILDTPIRKDIFIDKNDLQLDFVTSIQTLHKIEDNTISLISWFLTGLFLLLELVPIIVKAMMPSGIYDDILERIESKYTFDQQKIELQINSDFQDLKKKLSIDSEINNTLSKVLRASTKKQADNFILEQEQKTDKLNEKYQSELKILRKRYEIEFQKQEEFQQDLYAAKKIILGRIIAETETAITDNVSLIGEEYSEQVSQEIRDVIKQFEKAYQDVLSDRLNKVDLKANSDVISNIQTFEEGIRRIRKDALEQTKEKATDYTTNQLDDLAKSIVNSLTNDINKINNEISQFYSTSFNRIKSNPDFLNSAEAQRFILEYNKKMDEIRKQAMNDMIDRIKGLLETKITDAGERIPSDIVRDIENRLRNSI